MEAYQYKIRKEKSQLENIDFDLNDISLKNTEIKIIDKSIATKIIIEYEWLKSMPFIVKYCFGLYFNVNDKQYLGGVLVFSNDYAENTGVWDKYCFSGKLLLLSRGVCLWWTPKNSASFFISKACKWIKNNTQYRIITATVDPAAGEIGTIYQSLNWTYIGMMTGNYHHNKESKRFSVYIDGKLRGSRWVRNKLGTMKKDIILKHYPNAQFVNQYRKRRYFHFMDNKMKNQKYLKAFENYIQPYPKKDRDIIGIIYMITNKINNKKYIGQTIRGINDRISDYKNGQGNDYLNNSIKKYGWGNFEFKVIDNGETIDELNSKEIRYILEYNTTDKNFGYNIEAGGRNAIAALETLDKMSKSHLNIKQSKEWVEKRIYSAGSEEAKKYGKLKTDEERKYLSEISSKYWKGRSRDEETKNKISKTKIEQGLSNKQKEVICKMVYKINANENKIIKIYESTAEASKYENVNQSTISRWCSKNKKRKDIIWSYNIIK